MTKQSLQNKMSDAKLLKKKITEKLIFLKDNISDIEKITDSLIERGIIDILDRPKFLGDHKTPKEKIHLVLEEVIIKRKYVEFFCALHDTGNDHVLQEIGNFTDEEFAEFANLQDWTSSSPAPNAELFQEKDITQRAVQSFVLNVEKKELQQQISQLQKEQKQLLSQQDVLKQNINTLESENKRLQTSNVHFAEEKERLTIRVQQLEIKVHLLTKELSIKTRDINTIEKQNTELLRVIQTLKDQRIEDRTMHQKQREEDKTASQLQRKEDREYFAQHMTDLKADMKKEMQTVLNATLDQRENKNKKDEERRFDDKMDNMKTELQGTLAETFKDYLDKQRDQNKTFIDEVQAKLKDAKTNESSVVDNQRKEEKSQHNQTEDNDGRRLNPHMDKMKANPDGATGTNDSRNKSVTTNKINYNKTATLRNQIPKQ